MSNPTDLSVVQKIDDLLSDRQELLKIQENNRTRSKKFSIENNLSETLKVIDEVVN
jgi:glycosyltransferase involved in cell wall biosynthesis